MSINIFLVYSNNPWPSSVIARKCQAIFSQPDSQNNSNSFPTTCLHLQKLTSPLPDIFAKLSFNKKSEEDV